MLQDSWQDVRIGKFTASEIYKLMGAGRAKNDLFSKTALTYIDETIAEIITGQAHEIGSPAAIKWGWENEPLAIATYQEMTLNQVEYYGKDNPHFFKYNNFSGGSPDAIINGKTIGEVKCPYNSANHIQNILGSKESNAQEWLKENREDYYLQLQFNMLCTGLKEGIFISYDPRAVKQKHSIAIINIKFDEPLIEKLLFRLDAAIAIVKQTLNTINS